jgi:hypothetical protein
MVHRRGPGEVVREYMEKDFMETDFVEKTSQDLKLGSVAYNRYFPTTA